MQPGNWIFVVCVVLFTTVAAVCDARTKRLPNVLTVSAFAAAILFHLGLGGLSGGLSGAASELLFALAGFATGFGILFVLWLMGSGGGGDVKFMAALGAWIGAGATIKVFLVSAFLVLLGACVVLTWEFLRLGFRRSRAKYIESGGTKGGRKLAESERRTRRRLMPFGVPAALATWLVLCWQMQHG